MMDKLDSLKMAVMPGEFNIHRFDPTDTVPTDILAGGFFSICRTDEELSIVCPDAIPLASARCDAGWSCIKVLGPLDFSLTGILAHLAGLLAAAGISIFAVSTYDTDYILVKTGQLASAVAALEAGGHSFP
jgi:hypothetical protein